MGVFNHDLFGEAIEKVALQANRYPDVPGVRKGSPETSLEAAKDLTPKLGRLQRMAQEAISSAGRDGLTTDELAERLGLERWTIQPRTSELRAKGLIADSLRRRRNATGKKAVVWIAAAYVRAEAKE